MKPTGISAANANSSGTPGGADAATNVNAINIPINHEFSPHFANAEATANASYGSPNSHARQQQQPQSHQIPAHFQQGFGFEPDMDMDMDMFPRGRLGRMHHDPFSGFGTSHFGFPQFGSMGRRRMPASASDAMDDDGDFFNRLPTEFRQYIPEGFGHRRGGSGHHAQQQVPTQPQQHYPYHGQGYVPGSTPPSSYAGMQTQSPSKKVCDAAIQTEDSALSQDQVDHAIPSSAKPTDNLNHHGLRNTVDMGVKATPESEQHGPRAHSAPPPEQMQQNNGVRRPTPPQQSQFGTQTSPQVGNANIYQKAYYPPQQQPHPQQKQQTPPPSSQQQQPQTPGGTYVRTIPIFVEGRSEPIINAHKEIPNQNVPPPPSGAHTAHATANAKAGSGFQYPQQQQQPQHPQQHPSPHPHHQQQQRPSPLNTQQQPTQPQQQAAGGVPPQTPHTLDSINKIQDIQRDVLELMGKVEKFTGTRQDKEYVYLDEMLTRNLLKLDTIDTNGKESIRLARKEAIKCIQASINVLEAKAEENAKTAQGTQPASNDSGNASSEATATSEPMDQGESTTNQQFDSSAESKEQEPIPLPPPSVDKTNEAGNASTKEASPTPTAAETSAESSNSGTINETK